MCQSPWQRQVRRETTMKQVQLPTVRDWVIHLAGETLEFLRCGHSIREQRGIADPELNKTSSKMVKVLSSPALCIGPSRPTIAPRLPAAFISRHVIYAASVLDCTSFSRRPVIQLWNLVIIRRGVGSATFARARGANRRSND